MLEAYYLDEFKKMATVNRRVSKGEKEIPQLVEDILKDIKYFNAFDEFHYALEDDQHTTFDHIPILNEFKDFILPRSVRMEPGNLRTKDLLLRPKFEEEKKRKKDDVEDVNEWMIPANYKFDMYKYMINIADFRHYFKKDANSDITTLDALKRHISLSEALDLIYVEEDSNKFVKTGIDSLLPFRLNTDLEDLVEAGYFDSSYDVCVLNYMHKIIW